MQQESSLDLTWKEQQVANEDSFLLRLTLYAHAGRAWTLRAVGSYDAAEVGSQSSSVFVWTYHNRG